MNRTCDNCAYLQKKEEDVFCHITNPGLVTPIEDTDDHKCSRWERKSAKGLSNNPRKKVEDDIIIYEILR